MKRAPAKLRRSPTPTSKQRARRSAAAPTCSRVQASSCASTDPMPQRSKALSKGALLVGALDPARQREAIDGYAAAGLDALAMEWMPRITRAQSMDILSSQSNLAGYKAVVDAAATYGRAFPMMMTAAGHDQPGEGVRDGRRRRRPPGDRHRQAAGRAGQRDRRALGDERADPCRSAPSRSSSRMSPGSKARALAAMRPRCRRNTRKRRPSWCPATSPSRTSSSPPR